MTWKSAAETYSFTNALGLFGGDKFGEGDGVYLHSIRIMSGSVGGGMEGRGYFSSFQGKNVHLLHMESLGLFYSLVNGGGDGGHEEDHGGDLEPKEKLVNESDIVSNTCFGRQALEVSDVFLEAIVCDSVRAFK